MKTPSEMTAGWSLRTFPGFAGSSARAYVLSIVRNTAYAGKATAIITDTAANFDIARMLISVSA